MDTERIRQMLNAETTINNRLTDKAKENLATALNSGRYILFFGRLDNERTLHWHLNQEDFVDTDAERAVFELAKLIMQSRRSQTREVNHAVPDVVQQD